MKSDIPGFSFKNTKFEDIWWYFQEPWVCPKSFVQDTSSFSIVTSIYICKLHIYSVQVIENTYILTVLCSTWSSNPTMFDPSPILDLNRTPRVLIMQLYAQMHVVEYEPRTEDCVSVLSDLLDEQEIHLRWYILQSTIILRNYQK